MTRGDRVRTAPLLLACALLACVAGALAQTAPNWLNIVPSGSLVPELDQPNALLVKPHTIVMFNGYKDDCNHSVNTYWDNHNIYEFDTRTNQGRIVAVTGRAPHRRGSAGNDSDLPAQFYTAYAPGWVSSPGVAETTGGAVYGFFFDPFFFRDFSPIYQLNARNPSQYEWTSFTPLGDVPSPRAEASFVHDDLNRHLVYFFGGIGFGDAGLASHAEVFRYNTITRTFTKLSDTSPIDDGSDGIPKSRYHAIPFLYHYGPGEDDVEFQIHQGVHRTKVTADGGGDAEELLDNWAFDVKTRTWRQLTPNPEMPFSVRHGVQFQIRVPDGNGGDYDLLCLQSGDALHTDTSKSTYGCLFDVLPVPRGLRCNDPRANNGQGGWNLVATTGEEMDSKYVTASTIVSENDNAVYVLGGTYVLSRDDTTNWQVFHNTVRKLELNSLTGDDD